ncbi:hypothetical protein [Planktothrix pseudagardhii]|uniref:Uncharacterized protein n=1 Tax=Planktothrix pseudagardhii TaxID=132604 RepID=A0A9W4CG66_9CYAN|nr:hypothetical protein [Planktothrix pseudagardhii]CAD5927153.1 hypothetical protein NO713_01048 [Planktothrix pseudagardhii]
MAQITIEVPDDLSTQLLQLGDQLPELLRQCLVKPPLPAQVYRYILNFLSSQPTPSEIAQFRPTPEMQSRLLTLLSRRQGGDLTPAEQQELDEYERIEHLMILLKTGNLSFLAGQCGNHLDVFP